MLKTIADEQAQQRKDQIVMKETMQCMEAQMRDIHDVLVKQPQLVLPLKEWKSGIEVQLVIIERLYLKYKI